MLRCLESISFCLYFFLEHSTRIWPDLRFFFFPFTIPAIPEIPFCIANGDSMDSEISGSKASSRINLCQLTLLEKILKLCLGL